MPPPAASPTPSPVSPWRLRLGTGAFILGLAMPALIPLVRAVSMPPGLKTALSGAMVVGLPQLCTLAAVAILGRAGFAAVRTTIMGLLGGAARTAVHAIWPARVSRARHRVGVVMLSVPLLAAILGPYLASASWVSMESARSISLACDVLTVIAMVVLGGEFWEKVRRLFLYDDPSPPVDSTSNPIDR